MSLFGLLSAPHVSDARTVEKRPATPKSQKGDAGNRHIRTELSKSMPNHCFTGKTAKKGDASACFARKITESFLKTRWPNKGEKDWHAICRVTSCTESVADIGLDGVAWRDVPLDLLRNNLPSQLLEALSLPFNGPVASLDGNSGKK